MKKFFVFLLMALFLFTSCEVLDKLGFSDTLEIATIFESFVKDIVEEANTNKPDTFYVTVQLINPTNNSIVNSMSKKYFVNGEKLDISNDVGKILFNNVPFATYTIKTYISYNDSAKSLALNNEKKLPVYKKDGITVVLPYSYYSIQENFVFNSTNTKVTMNLQKASKSLENKNLNGTFFGANEDSKISVNTVEGASSFGWFIDSAAIALLDQNAKDKLLTFIQEGDIPTIHSFEYDFNKEINAKELFATKQYIEEKLIELPEFTVDGSIVDFSVYLAPII